MQLKLQLFQQLNLLSNVPKELMVYQLFMDYLMLKFDSFKNVDSNHNSIFNVTLHFLKSHSSICLQSFVCTLFSDIKLFLSNANNLHSVKRFQVFLFKINYSVY